MQKECDRTRLIGELSSLLKECDLPEDARAAGLTLIGFLARRMPGECVSAIKPQEMGAAQARLRIIARRTVTVTIEACAEPRPLKKRLLA